MPTPPSTTRRLEDISGAAEYVGVTSKTIRRWIKSGHITGYRVGPRLIRVDLNELDLMLIAVGSETRRRETGEEHEDERLERLHAHIERMVASFPPLTEEQLDTIAALLRNASPRAGGADA